LIELANAGIEETSGDEIQILPVVVEDWIVVVVKAGGDLRGFLRFERIDEYIVRAATVWFGIREPTAVGRPCGVGNVSIIALIDLDRFFLVEGHYQSRWVLSQ